MSLAEGSTVAEIKGGAKVLHLKKFKWRLENFDVIRRSEETVNAQSFSFEAEKTFGCDESSKWEVYLSSGMDDDYDKIHLFYKKISSEKLPSVTYSQLKVKILYRDGDEWDQGETDVLMDDDSGSPNCSFGLYWGEDGLSQQSTSEIPLEEDGSLVLHLEWRLFQTSPKTVDASSFTTVESWKRRGSRRPNHANKVCSDLLKALLLSENGTHDIKLVAKDGQVFKAHKAILCARSRVFAAMLLNGMKEAKSGIVRIEDVSPRGVKAMLHYIYTGALIPIVEESGADDDVDNMDVDDVCSPPHSGSDKERTFTEELIYTAQKYELEDIIDHFDETLGEGCNSKNALFFLRLANKYSLKNAEKRIFESIKGCPALLGDCFDKLAQMFTS